MNIFKKIFFLFFPQFKKSDFYVEELREKGVHIGQGTHFFGPAKTEVDVQRPWMLNIGEYCKFASGVKILTHDYSRSVLRRYSGDIIGESGKTIIGNNVFVGMDSIILMGTHIGDNVVIGAGSVVKGVIESNSVYAGNPAKKICTLEEFYNKRANQQLEEAVLYFKSFVENYNREPTISEMGPFWWMFLPRREESVLQEKVFTALSGDCEDEVIESFLKSKPIFEDYKKFKEYVFANQVDD